MSLNTAPHSSHSVSPAQNRATILPCASLPAEADCDLLSAAGQGKGRAGEAGGGVGELLAERWLTRLPVTPLGQRQVGRRVSGRCHLRRLRVSASVSRAAAVGGSHGPPGPAVRCCSGPPWPCAAKGASASLQQRRSLAQGACPTRLIGVAAVRGRRTTLTSLHPFTSQLNLSPLHRCHHCQRISYPHPLGDHFIVLRPHCSGSDCARVRFVQRSAPLRLLRLSLSAGHSTVTVWPSPGAPAPPSPPSTLPLSFFPPTRVTAARCVRIALTAPPRHRAGPTTPMTTCPCRRRARPLPLPLPATATPPDHRLHPSCIR